MRSISFFFIMIFSQIGFAQSDLKPLFQQNKIIEITLACNLKNVMLDVDNSRAIYHPASLSFLDEQLSPVTISVQVKTRGHFRRLKENCSLPPLRIKFNEQNVQSTIFKGQGRLKLVTNCKMGNKRFEQYIIKEYLVYKAYNLITPFSFNVRMVKINFVDIENRVKNFTTHAFFIEDKDDMASRNAGKILSTQGIHQEAVNQKMMNELAVFQFLIGNTDWSVSKLHNTELVVLNEMIQIVPIPYDFDFCGIVNPPYTKPPEILPIQHVTERLYRGFCNPKEELEPVFVKFKDLKDDLELLYTKDSLLDLKEKKRILKYIEDFYNIIDSPKQKEREFYEYCRKD